MNRHLYYWMPSWMKKTIRGRSCAKCKTPVNTEDIIAVGIRELQDGQCRLFAEHQCAKCKHRSITTFGNNKTNTVQELCFILLESIRVKKALEKARRMTEKIKNGMSDKKVKNFLNFLKNVPNHDDFLKHIGCPAFHDDTQPKPKEKPQSKKKPTEPKTEQNTDEAKDK